MEVACIMSTAQATLRDQMLEHGFLIAPGVLSPELLAELRDVTDRLLAATTAEERELYKYQGSNIRIAWQDPVFARLLAWPATLDLIRALGFPDPKIWDGYILSKPAKAPPLYWHQDWPYWSEPISAEPDAAQIVVLYYLTETTRENGCLRVLPGSHRRRMPLHDVLGDAHSEATYKADLNSPLFADHPGAIDVPVGAGDAIVFDARLLHCARGNQTDHVRTGITTLYLPRFEQTPESLRAAQIQNMLPLPETLSAEERQLLEPHWPHYAGPATPSLWDRQPDAYLAR